MSLEQSLAMDVLTMAYVGGMPETFWHSDARIKRACGVLGIEPGWFAYLAAKEVVEG